MDITLAEIKSNYYDDGTIVGKVSKKIKVTTEYYMKKYGLSLNDAFEDAVKELAPKNSELYRAWYYGNCDFRKYIPSCYRDEYLDFTKYPITYNLKYKLFSIIDPESPDYESLMLADANDIIKLAKKYKILK